MILETIKNLLGEELTKQVETALKGKGKDGKDVDLVIGNDGSYVPATKFDEEKKLRAAAEQTVRDRDKQIDDLSKVDTAGLQAEITRLKDENATAKTNYENTIAAIRLDSALDSVIVAARGKNTTAVKSLIANKDKLKLKDDGTVEGLDLEAIKTSAPYLFEQVETKPEGGDPAAGGNGRTGETELEKMSYAEYKAWREKN